MSDSLFLRTNGPLPRPQRRALDAAEAGNTPWAQAAARGRVRDHAQSCRDTQAAIAALHPRTNGPRPARLGVLSRRLAAQRATCERWRRAAETPVAMRA